MEIIVCVKRVPETADADISIDNTGMDIVREGLVFEINEWDNCAVQEAIILKEKYGGPATFISLGPEEDNETLRRARAMGAEEPFASQIQPSRVPMDTQLPEPSDRMRKLWISISPKNREIFSEQPRSSPRENSTGN